MRKHLALLFIFAFLLTNISANVGFCLPAIPNAPFQQGFGMDTPAGSGRHLGTPSTTIYKVTNLNDFGPGSLRDALAQALTGPVTIVFEVSGTIELQSGLWLPSYLTIAGQTAPSPGITIKNKPVFIERNAHDILVQHIRFRVGDVGVDGNPDMVDSLQLDNHYRIDPDGDGPDIAWTPPYNIVFDHCSFSWGIDECIETGADNITFIDCIISEGLSGNQHTKGWHSRGMIVLAYNDGAAGGQNMAIVQNVFAHNEDRNPLILTGYGVIANNVVYDFKFGISVDDAANDGGLIKASIIGNYMVDGTDIESYCIYIKAGVEEDSRIYMGDDNYFDGAVQTDPWNLDEGYSCFEQRRSSGETGSDVPEANKVYTATEAIWPTGYTTMTAANARTYVLSNAGARPADRDAVDARIIAEVIAESGSSALVDTVAYTNADCTALYTPFACCTGPGTGTCNQVPEGGWPTLAENHRTLDIPSNPTEIQPSGYTKLEEWLHGFSRTVEGEDITGDVTGDEQVNIQDIQACVNHILGMQDWGIAADVNDDDAVNVLDVQEIVNVILSG